MVTYITVFGLELRKLNINSVEFLVDETKG